MALTNVEPVLKIDSRQWHEQLASVIAAAESVAFPETMVRALRHLVRFDYSVWFVYRGNQRPVCVYDTFTPKERTVFVEDYQLGPYLLDPFFRLSTDRSQPGLYRLREIAPDRFYHSEYFRSYYRRTRLSEEIAFLVTLQNGQQMTISLMRAGSSAVFSDRDLAKLKKIEPVVQSASSRQWKNDTNLRDHYVDSITDDTAAGSPVSTAFENFGSDKLTIREREVVRMVLRGHSSESIGKHCGITTGTVKIHRKNIYAKLGISTQSELFSLFISEL